MTTLRKALAAGNLNQFIAEREAEAAPAGNEPRFTATLQAMTQSKKAVRATSKPRHSGD